MTDPRTALEGSSPEQPSGQAPADNDKTRFRMPASAIEGSGADHTRLRPEPAAVAAETPLSSRAAASPSQDNSGASTGSAWGDPALWQDVGGPTLGSGSVIKGRFVLEESIGSGGMGTVFKARDLRKVEAEDRNPHVAIKVLNEEFRRHPQSLQALQRESRKTQKLAHPNIVTVYDFDRDGANVFMVMELLEGEPLDRLIKRAEGVGIGVKEALQITQGVCRAMAYAHEQGIVHADFKPANAFITKKNVVKVLDFGIARAAKHNEQASGDMTLFDPGTLGALTPAYAGCEVIEGKEADARDDVYAIACVTYELIAGRHPFNRLSAAQAHDAGVSPDPPRGLSNRQWRTLRRGLSLRREQRPMSAMQFFDGLRPLRRMPAVYAAVGGAVIAAVVAAVMLASGQIETYRDRSVARALASADARRIEALLPRLREFEPARRASVFLDDAARTGFAKYFETRMDALVDARTGHYDYPGAEALLGELEEFLPDSQVVQNLRERLAARKTEELKRESAAFDTDLQHGWLLPEQNRENVSSLLVIARQADPHSALLHDARLPGAFAEQARQALQRGDIPLGASLTAAGLVFDPRDATLLGLRDQTQRVASSPQTVSLPQPASQQQAAADSQTVASSQPAPDTALRGQQAVPASGQSSPQPTNDSLRAQIVAALAQPAISLPQARALAESAEELTRRGDPDGRTLALQLRERLAKEAAHVQSTQSLDAAIRFAEGAYALFPESRDLRNRLIQLHLATTQRASKQREASIVASQKRIDSLLHNPRIDDAWSKDFDRELQRLGGAGLPESDPYVSQVKAQAASLCLTQAAALRGQQRLAEARHVLELSARYVPDSAGFAQEEKLLAGAERAAQVNSLEQKLLEQAQANEVDQALLALNTLRAELPANDAFVTREGPGAIAGACLRLALLAAQEGRFTLALGLVNQGRTLAPSQEQIASARARYTRYQAIDQYLTSRERIDARSVHGELVGFARQQPAEATAAAQGLLRNLVARINSTHDPGLANRLLRAARDIFGEQSVAQIPSHPDSTSAQ